MLGRVALARKLPPPDVLSGWESAQWIYDERRWRTARGSRRRRRASCRWIGRSCRSKGRRKKLLVADMDSTIINVECLDELADFAGLKAEIAAITERAMRGELAFEPALRERVGKLKGLALGALQRTYDERVRLNPGAATLGAHHGRARRALRAGVGRLHISLPRAWPTRPAFTRNRANVLAGRWRGAHRRGARADPRARGEAGGVAKRSGQPWRCAQRNASPSATAPTIST